MLETHEAEGEALPLPLPSALRISLIDQFDALESRRAEWDALVARSTTPTIFQTYEWHESWWRVFGAEYELWVLLAEADGELVGIAPLMLSRRRVHGVRRRVLEFIGAPLGSDYCDFIVAQDRPEVLKQLLASLYARRDQWDLLLCSEIPDSSPTVKAIPAFFDARHSASVIMRLNEAPTCVFENPDEDRKRIKKKDIQAHHNYYKRNGKLEFKDLTDAEEIKPYLDTFFAQHIARRAQMEEPSQFLDPRRRTFYQKAIESLAPMGGVVFSILFFEEAPIAFHLGFALANRIVSYTPTFDLAHAKHGPGQVLLKHLLEDALEHKVSEFDFSIGEEPYKYRFANRIRHTYAINVYRRRGDYLRHRMRIWGRARLAQHPRLEHVARTIVHWLRDRFQ
jgi:CelD/BcsL family acetyltransferase involved in cellulose biosynthesis